MIERSTHPARLSPAWKGNTEPVLCDLGQARMTPVENSEQRVIQSAPYRAPEVVFDITPWGPGVDIWNVGTLVSFVFNPRCCTGILRFVHCDGLAYCGYL